MRASAGMWMRRTFSTLSHSLQALLKLLRHMLNQVKSMLNAKVRSMLSTSSHSLQAHGRDQGQAVSILCTHSSPASKREGEREIGMERDGGVGTERGVRAGREGDWGREGGHHSGNPPTSTGLP